MLTQLMRFGLVGILGTLSNLIVFTVVVKLLLGHPNLGATLAFLAAVTQNFILNRLWTFHVKGHDLVGFAPGWAKYVTINLVGFGVNLIVLNAVIAWMGHDWSLQGQALGILCGMVFNFFLSRILVFARPRARHP